MYLPIASFSLNYSTCFRTIGKKNTVIEGREMIEYNEQLSHKCMLKMNVNEQRKDY